MKRKILTALLLICTLAALFAVNTVAAEVASGTCGDNLTWTLDDAGTLTISGEGAMAVWMNSSQVPWNSYRSNIKSVVIGDGVTSIGNAAFYNCGSLTNVYIGDSVTSIGGRAFYNCTSLTSVDIPDSVTTIGAYAFYDCTSLTSVVIGNGVTSIGWESFYECGNLTSVVIGDSVTSVGEDAFYECSNLTDVYITDLEAWCNIEFYDYNSNPLYSGASLYINNTLATHITIPNTIQEIKPYAFFNCGSLTNVNIGAGVTTIGYYAFRKCRNLTSVDIGNSVISIGEDAFSYCDDLSSVVIGDSVTTIGASAFDSCDSLTSVTIPTSLTSIGSDAFSSCYKLTDVYYDGVQSQWVKIEIGTNNAWFNNATVHYTGIPVTGITLNKTLLSLLEGESAQLIPTISPQDAADKSVSWSSSNNAIATVSNGVVTAVSAGKATITVITADGGYTAECELTVTAPPTLLSRDTVLVLDNSGSMSGEPLAELKSAAVKFCETVLDANGTNRIAIVIYDSDVSSYCSFTNDISIIKNLINKMNASGGTNTNSALVKAGSLISASEAAVRSIVLMTDGLPQSGTSYTNGKYTSKDSSYYYSYANGVYNTAETLMKSINLYSLGFFHSMSSSDKAFASRFLNDIQNTGYYEVTDGDSLDIQFSDIANSITRIPVTEFALDKDEIVLTAGESAILNYVIKPHDATNQTVYWSSSNDSIATVTNGVVNAIAEGKITVTAKTADGGFVDECTVIVNSLESWYYTYTVSDNKATITGTRPGLPSEIVIPSYIQNYPVTAIAQNAFCESLFEKIVVPENVTSLENMAFAYCNKAKEIILSNGLVNIGYSAFSDCDSLTSIYIPDSVSNIAYNAFWDCNKLTGVLVSENNSYYSNDEFGALFNKDKTTIIWYFLANTNTEYTIPDGVTCIGSQAFYKCNNLTKVDIPSSVTRIEQFAFQFCDNLTSIHIPDGVTYIGQHAFSSSKKLKNVIISNSLIGISAFSNCTSLTSVVISDSVTSIEKSAFNNCTSLTDVYYTGSEDEWNAINIDWGNDPLLNATIHFNYVPYVLGDVNGDKEVTSEDSVFLARYFAKWSGYTDTVISADIADLDNSGVVDTTDSVILSRHLAKWTGYLELPIA